MHYSEILNIYCSIFTSSDCVKESGRGKGFFGKGLWIKCETIVALLGILRDWVEFGN